MVEAVEQAMQHVQQECTPGACISCEPLAALRGLPD